MSPFSCTFHSKSVLLLEKKKKKVSLLSDPVYAGSVYKTVHWKRYKSALSLKRRLVILNVIQEGKFSQWNTLHCYFSCILQVCNSKEWNKENPAGLHFDHVN